jgi:hypothetical protein
MRAIQNCMIIGSCLTVLLAEAAPTKGYLNAKNETPKGICSSDQAWVKFGTSNSKVQATGKVLCAGDKNAKLRYQLYPGDIHYMWGLESDRANTANRC